MSPRAGPVRESVQPHKSPSRTSPPPSSPGYSAPTTFFLRRESEISHASENLIQQSTQETVESKQHDSEEDMADSSYGVQSLADTLEGAFPARSRDASPSTASTFSQDNRSETSQQQSPRADLAGSKKRKAGNPIHPKILATAQRIISGDQSPARSSSRSHHVATPSCSSVSSLREYPRKGSDLSINQPPSPLQLSSRPDSGLAGTPRSASVRSLRLSDEEGSVLDDTGSQAINSSSGEEDDYDETHSHADAVGGAEQPTSGPQLVMPSIAMPSRRPFTERGRRMGKLKVMVAGREGIGKTSFIRSLVQACEDIVHVDPPSAVSATPDSMGQTHRDRSSTNGTVVQTSETSRRTMEVHASTKPYPSWWSDVEESRTLRRRRSMGDVVLERNVCFVDTFGWQTSDLAEGVRESSYKEVAELPEICMKQNAALGAMGESQLLSIFTNGGGSQVDAIVYLLSGK